MALPISVIGTNFSQAWDNRKEEEKLANAVDEDPVEIAETSLAEVSHDLNVFNNACANHVELCKNAYLELMSPLIRRIWKYFKKYTLTLASDTSQYSNEKAVQKCFLRLLLQQQVYNENVNTLRQVYDEDTNKQFERAKTNAKWKQDCIDKADSLCKDISAMRTVLGILELPQDDKSKTCR